MGREVVIKEFRDEFFKIRKEKLESKPEVNNLKKKLFEKADYIDLLQVKFEEVHLIVDEPSKYCMSWLDLMGIEYKTSYDSYYILNL